MSLHTDFSALCIRPLFQRLHLCFANKPDGSRVRLCSSCKHTSMQTPLSSTGVKTFDLSIFYMFPLYPPFYLSWQSLLEQRLHKSSPADPASWLLAPTLRSHGHCCIPPPRLRRAKWLHQHPGTLCVLVCWSLPGLRPWFCHLSYFIFHFGAAVSGIKPHYCHRCTAQEETGVQRLRDMSRLMKEVEIRDMNNWGQLSY